MGNDDIIQGFDEETCDYLKIWLQEPEEAEHCLVVTLVGSIGTYNSNFLRRRLMRAADAGFLQQILVQSQLDYVSSTGIGTLLTMLRVLMEKGGGQDARDGLPSKAVLPGVRQGAACSEAGDASLPRMQDRAHSRRKRSRVPVNDASPHLPRRSSAKTRRGENPYGNGKRIMSNKDTLPGLDDEQCDFLTIDLYRMEDPCTCVVLRLKGQIDTYSAGFFQRSARKVTDAGFIRLIIVLSDVDYLSSKAVGVFVQLRKAATEMGGGIAVVSLHPKVRNIFRNLNLERFLCCTNTLEEAVALLDRIGDGGVAQEI